MAGKIKGAMPPKPGPKQEIVRVTTVEPVKFTVLSSAIFGQNIHWFGGRSHECSSDKSSCINCEKGWPQKWKGYIHAIEWREEKRVFVELTPTAARLLLATTIGEETLRGMVIEIHKSKGGAKGKYYVTRIQQRINMATLPSEEDPAAILKFLWASKNSSGQLPA